MMIVRDSYGTSLDDVTAPIVCLTLAEKVDAVDRFGLDGAGLDDWHVVTDPDLDGWVIRWSYLRITVGERSDLELARFIARERLEARRFLARTVALARIALGWPRGGGAPLVRCVVCRTSTVASAQHAPGDASCIATQAARRLDHAE